MFSFKYLPTNKQSKLDMQFSEPIWKIIGKRGAVNMLIENIIDGQKRLTHKENVKLCTPDCFQNCVVQNPDKFKANSIPEDKKDSKSEYTKKWVNKSKVWIK